MATRTDFIYFHRAALTDRNRFRYSIREQQRCRRICEVDEQLLPSGYPREHELLLGL